MANIITLANTSLCKQTLKQQADRQQIIRLFRGAYINANEYAELDIAGKYRARAEAFLLTHPKLRAWGITAAALEGAPVLQAAPLHFAGAHGSARSRQKGCVFHEVLPSVPAVNNRTAEILFECATTSPLPDALLAANFLFRSLSDKADGSLMASRDVDGQSSEALIRLPLNSQTARIKVRNAPDVGMLDTRKPNFLETYSSARNTEFSSPDAELLWFDFAQLCVAHSNRRAVRKALLAGLYFTDKADSAAESLLLARCVELGFQPPLLQVDIFDPASAKHLGRVDGLWPSSKVLKGLRQGDGKYGRFLYSKQYGDNSSVVVEFDGRTKYGDNYSEALEQERLRQNAIGNLGFRFIRISWNDLMQPDSLRLILAAAKIPKPRKS